MTRVLLKEWLSNSKIYRVLHAISYEHFDKINSQYVIPSIIITAISAGLAFSVQIFPSESTIYIPVIVGVLNLVASTFTSIASFRKYPENAEGHRLASITFAKLSRKLQHKLSVNKKFDDSFVELIRSDLDQLVEVSPAIPHSILAAFKEANKERNLILPSIIDLGANIKLPNERHEKATSLFGTPVHSPRGHQRTNQVDLEKGSFNLDSKE